MRIDPRTPPVRSFLAVTAFVVFASIAVTPVAQGALFILVRDYYTGVSSADWNDANVAANVAGCAATVNSIVPSAYPWMKAPLAAIAEYDAAGRYAFSLYDEGFALYSIYMYYALSDPDYFDFYLDLAAYFQSEYRDLADAASDLYWDQYLASKEQFISAWAAAGNSPADGPNYIDAVLSALYGSVWLGNDYYYCFEEGSSGYNLWVSYGAPYYALSLWYAGFAEYYFSGGRNLYEATMNDISYVDPEEQRTEAEALQALYDESAYYWSAWRDYYRILSFSYES